MNNKVVLFVLISILLISAGCVNPTQDSFLDNKTKLSAMNGAHGNGVSLTVGYTYNSSIYIDNDKKDSLVGVVDSQNNSAILRQGNRTFLQNSSGTYVVTSEDTIQSNSTPIYSVTSPSEIDLTKYQEGEVRTEETEEFGVASVGIVEGRTSVENESVEAVVNQINAINATDSYSVSELETRYVLPSEALGIREVTVTGTIEAGNESYNFTHRTEYDYFTSYSLLKSTQEKLLR